MKVKRVRTKRCDNCEQERDTLYRIQNSETDGWIFVCGNCLSKFKKDNPSYVYGGTWKARKRH